MEGTIEIILRSKTDTPDIEYQRFCHDLCKYLARNHSKFSDEISINRFVLQMKQGEQGMALYFPLEKYMSPFDMPDEEIEQTVPLFKAIPFAQNNNNDEDETTG